MQIIVRIIAKSDEGVAQYSIILKALVKKIISLHLGQTYLRKQNKRGLVFVTLYILIKKSNYLDNRKFLP